MGLSSTLLEEVSSQTWQDLTPDRFPISPPTLLCLYLSYKIRQQPESKTTTLIAQKQTMYCSFIWPTYVAHRTRTLLENVAVVMTLIVT